VAVIHTLIPGAEGSPSAKEWQARLRRAIEALQHGQVSKVVVTGGRGVAQGTLYDNPNAIRKYLLDHGVPEDAVLWCPISDEDLDTSRNPMDTTDEVRQAMVILKRYGWNNVRSVRPITNWLHMARVRVTYFASRCPAPVRPLPTPIYLGLRWVILEMVMCWPYTLLDPKWLGPIAQKMRASRRRAI